MEILIGYLDVSIDLTLSINLQLRVQSCFEEMSQYFVMFISDVDECQDATPCGANEQCSNEQGSYSCICRLGYRKQNNVCVKKGECSKVIDVRVSCVCPVVDNELSCNIVKVAVDPRGDNRVGMHTTLTIL